MYVALVGRSTWRAGGQEGREISDMYFPDMYQSFAFVPWVLGSKLIKKKACVYWGCSLRNA